MTTRKRTDYLEIDGSENEEDRGYDSEAFEEKKGGRTGQLPGRATKRRRVSLEAGVYDDDEGQSASDGAADDAGRRTDSQDGEPSGASLPSQPTPSSSAPKSKPSPTVKPLTASEVAASRLSTSRTGVVYLSRIPPFMKPTKLRSLLTPFGPLNRIFLSPEDPASHTARVRSGGNKKRSFTDGWVEFRCKADAKVCAETLNAQSVGGRKGGFYYDDVWNMKYLTGFKWHHLTEQIANENAERAARLRTEIGRSRKEEKEWVRNVERGKMLGGMERKKAAKRARQAEASEGAEKVKDGVGEKGGEKKGPQRQFRQNAVLRKGSMAGKDGSGRAREQPEEVKRVLSKIF